MTKKANGLHASLSSLLTDSSGALYGQASRSGRYRTGPVRHPVLCRSTAAALYCCCSCCRLGMPPASIYITKPNVDFSARPRTSQTLTTAVTSCPDTLTMTRTLVSTVTQCNICMSDVVLHHYEHGDICTRTSTNIYLFSKK